MTSFLPRRKQGNVVVLVYAFFLISRFGGGKEARVTQEMERSN